MRTSHALRAALAGLALSLVVARANVAAVVVPPATPPTIVAPQPFLVPLVSPPFLFEWTASAPGQIVDAHITSRTSLAAASIVGLSYELQISDRVDVASHPLFDVISDQTSYLFANDLGSGGFTNEEPPDTTLPGGRYFWRVRTVYAGSASAYSRVGSFRLATRGGGAPFHALGIVGLRLAGTAHAGATTLLVATVQNLGTFSEAPATLNLFADGIALGTAAVEPLGSSGVRSFSVPWTPAQSGLANLYATLDYADDDQTAHSIALTAIVLGPASVRTQMLGTVALRLGNVTLVNDGGAVVATLAVDRGVSLDLASFAGRRVRIDGRLSAANGGFVLVVRSIGPEKTKP